MTMDKLKGCQTLEEQGNLINLPCKLGVILYEVSPLTNRITEREISQITIVNAPI